jgi:hypothetical protein
MIQAVNKVLDYIDLKEIMIFYFTNIQILLFGGITAQIIKSMITLIKNYHLFS